MFWLLHKWCKNETTATKRFENWFNENASHHVWVEMWRSALFTNQKTNHQVAPHQGNCHQTESTCQYNPISHCKHRLHAPTANSHQALYVAGVGVGWRVFLVDLQILTSWNL